MRIINKVVAWMLYTSLFAACCAVGMCMATERLLLNDIPHLITPLHIFIFGSTLVVYNVHRLIKISTPERSDAYTWSKHYRFFSFGACLTGLGAAIVSLYSLSREIWIACIVLGILAFAYSLPLLPFANKKSIRDFGWIKILTLTSVWTIVTSVLPMLYWNKHMADYPFEILIRFVFMFTLCVAFDIRDMQTDKDAEIFTLPNRIGVRNSYRLMNGTILLFALLCMIQYLRYPSLTRLSGELLTAVATKWAINYTKKHPSDKAYLGLVDGMMLLYALLVLVH